MDAGLFCCGLLCHLLVGVALALEVHDLSGNLVSQGDLCNKAPSVPLRCAVLRIAAALLCQKFLQHSLVVYRYVYKHNKIVIATCNPQKFPYYITDMRINAWFFLLLTLGHSCSSCRESTGERAPDAGSSPYKRGGRCRGRG